MPLRRARFGERIADGTGFLSPVAGVPPNPFETDEGIAFRLVSREMGAIRRCPIPASDGHGYPLPFPVVLRVIGFIRDPPMLSAVAFRAGNGWRDLVVVHPPAPFADAPVRLLTKQPVSPLML